MTLSIVLLLVILVKEEDQYLKKSFGGQYLADRKKSPGCFAYWLIIIKIG